jgi:hypothetical protein
LNQTRSGGSVPRWQLPDALGEIGRGKLCGEPLFGRSAGATRDAGEEVRAVLDRDVWLQEREAGERDVPGCELSEDRGESSREASGFDTSTCFVFAEAQMFEAVLEERGIAASEHGGTGVEFRQMRHDVGHARSLRRNECVEAGEEACVGEFFESHAFQ